MATPLHLSLNDRPYNVSKMAEFVHHLGDDVEFIATDTIGNVYGGITRSQMIELLSEIPIAQTYSICKSNHGKRVL